MPVAAEDQLDHLGNCLIIFDDEYGGHDKKYSIGPEIGYNLPAHLLRRYQESISLAASNRSEFFAGIRAQVPILLGVTPFGMIYGVLAISAGLPTSLAQAMSAVVFAGSSQFIATNLSASGAPFVVILLTTFVVNLRHA
ncbi:MAG: AzlC family ABC transporter permease, partial [Chloroflexi bacterium]|nr:AzlC family ABC transporter permease [Chloroflexota bacterium]